MRVYAFICRHFLYTVSENQKPRPRQTCDSKKPYCDSCLISQQIPQSETLATCLASLETLHITENTAKHNNEVAVAKEAGDLEILLAGLSMKENVDVLMAALQRKMRRELDAFVAKHGEEVAIAMMKHVLKTWEDTRR